MSIEHCWFTPQPHCGEVSLHGVSAQGRGVPPLPPVPVVVVVEASPPAPPAPPVPVEVVVEEAPPVPGFSTGDVVAQAVAARSNAPRRTSDRMDSTSEGRRKPDELPSLRSPPKRSTTRELLGEHDPEPAGPGIILHLGHGPAERLVEA